jgi:hypothetical protein
MTTELVVKVEGTDTKRALIVKEQIDHIRLNLHDGLFDLAELLAEARTNSYHTVYGFQRFGEWVEQGSGLDMSERTAYYLIGIITKAKELGIPREQLKLAKMSKLKEIFSLDPQEFGDNIKQLVASSEGKSLQEVRDEVQQIKVGSGAETFVFMTLKIPRTVKEQIVDPAFELVRKQYGDVRDKDGNILDLTDSKCLEFISVAYTQDPNNEDYPSEGA